MNSEILDDDFQSNEDKSKPTFINWISVIILWIGIFWSIFEGLITNWQVAAGFILLIIGTILCIANFSKGVKFIFIILFLATVNLIEFIPIVLEIEFGFFDIGIGLDFVHLGILLLHYFTNKKELAQFLDYIINKPISEEEKQASIDKKISAFKYQFSKRSLKELKEIENNERLLPEAIQAAKELIKEKTRKT